MDSSNGLLMLVCGPAGSGKTTLCSRMLEAFPEINRVVTSTTRPPRPGERHGEDYYFFDEPAFLRMRDEGAFYETARVHDRWYGTLRSEIDNRLARGSDLLLNVDVQGAAAFRNAARDNPELARRLVSVFIMPPSLEEIRRRMHARGSDGEAEIARRLATAEKEIRERPHFDHVIVSGTRDEDFVRLREFYLGKKNAGGNPSDKPADPLPSG